MQDKDTAYYESLGKRTKEYKEWKTSFDKDVKGAGDIIQKITQATGIDKAVKKVLGKDCGCDERKETLNKLIKWKPVRCFTEEQYNEWTAFRERENKNKVTHQEQQLIVELCKQLFARAVNPCSSGGGSTCTKYIDMIDDFYLAYQ